jgi:hypothetical protein
MTKGVSANDFLEIHSDFKRTISYEAVTKTIDPITGDEVLVYATAEDKEVIFFLEDKRFQFDKEGLVELGDAYIMTPVTFEPSRMDKFSIDNRKYLIKQVLKRYVMDVAMHFFCVCYIAEDDDD